MTITVEGTVQERFRAAVVTVQRAGVVFASNVRKCCTGCIEAKDVGLASSADFDTVPGAYTYGSQGQGYAFSRSDGMPYRRNRDRSKVKTIYVGHWGPGVVAATAVAEAFRAQGFEVEWNGSEYRKVEVTIPWEDAS